VGNSPGVSHGADSSAAKRSLRWQTDSSSAQEDNFFNPLGLSLDPGFERNCSFAVKMLWVGNFRKNISFATAFALPRMWFQPTTKNHRGTSKSPLLFPQNVDEAKTQAKA
jgi:hypothetical protein